LISRISGRHYDVAGNSGCFVMHESQNLRGIQCSLRLITKRLLSLPFEGSVTDETLAPWWLVWKNGAEASPSNSNTKPIDDGLWRSAAIVSSAKLAGVARESHLQGYPCCLLPAVSSAVRDHLHLICYPHESPGIDLDKYDEDGLSWLAAYDTLIEVWRCNSSITLPTQMTQDTIMRTKGGRGCRNGPAYFRICSRLYRESTRTQLGSQP